VSLESLLSLAPGARLLQGGIDRIQGHAQGDLVLAAPIASLRSAAWGRLSADEPKVLGFIADDL
jgi:D-methionine transport system ATP-binding protein